MLEASSKVIKHNICSDMQYNCLLGIWILLADYSTTNNLQIAVSYRSLRVQLMKSKLLLRKCVFPRPWFCFLIKSIAMEPKQVQNTRRGICETFKISLAFISFIQVFDNYEAYCTVCFCGKLWESITIFQRKKCTPHFRNFKEHLSFDKW